MRLFHHFLYACKYIIFAVMTQEKLPHRKELCLQSEEITPVISFLGLFFVMQAVALFTKDIRRFLNGFFLIEFNA